MTGRYPFRSGMTRNPTPDAGINDVGLPATEITLAQALKPRGYATCCIGKWHLGHTPEFLPTRRGFDEYLGILYSNDMRPVQLVENERVAEYPVVQATLTRRYTERALAFIERNRERPFFLYLPHAMPHKPLAASEDFYAPGTSKELYAAAVRELDWSAGEILDRLRKLNLDQNTLVFFTSDNGPWYGGSTGGLRGMKGRPWEGGVRVPMIARWPGKIPAGRVSSEVAGTIDFYPTCVKIAGAVLPSDRTIDGRDLYPLLSGAESKSPHEALFLMAGQNLSAVRSGKWKLHVAAPGADSFLGDVRTWVDPRGPDGFTIIAPFEQARPDQHPGLSGGAPSKPMLLFDMEADPEERRDVAADHPEVVRRLREAYDRLNAQVDKTPPPPGRAGGGMLRIKGGELRYDRQSAPQK
jgi:arylsulfatase A-like enzyme